MLVFTCGSMALGALLTKLVLIDLTLLKRNFMESLSLIDTTLIPGQIESLLGYKLDSLLDQAGLNTKQQDFVKSYLQTLSASQDELN